MGALGLALALAHALALALALARKVAAAKLLSGAFAVSTQPAPTF